MIHPQLAQITHSKDIGQEPPGMVPEQFGIPMLTPDGRYLFFSSGGDIYWVDAGIIEEPKLK